MKRLLAAYSPTLCFLNVNVWPISRTKDCRNLEVDASVAPCLKCLELYEYKNLPRLVISSPTLQRLNLCNHTQLNRAHCASDPNVTISNAINLKYVKFFGLLDTPLGFTSVDVPLLSDVFCSLRSRSRDDDGGGVDSNIFEYLQQRLGHFPGVERLTLDLEEKVSTFVIFTLFFLF